MRQDNQFIEMNREEFLHWIMGLKINRKITHIQNHHTWEPNYNNGSDSIQLSKNMKNYHVNDLGWVDIAQQFTTVKNGLICTGRSLEKDPAGIASHNTGGICIENVGNFDINGDTMTTEHLKTIVFLNAVLCLKFGLDVSVDTIVYHTWFSNLNEANKKTCPGTNFFKGNTKQSAINNFYPLINQEILEIKKSLIGEVINMFNDEDKIAGWAKPSVDKLASLGLIKGDNNGNVNPENPITRQEFCVVIDRLLALLGK